MVKQIIATIGLIVVWAFNANAECWIYSMDKVRQSGYRIAEERSTPVVYGGMQHNIDCKDPGEKCCEFKNPPPLISGTGVKNYVIEQVQLGVNEGTINIFPVIVSWSSNDQGSITISITQ